ncbi:lectin ADEL-like [Mya arenaria]|uniref:lectin ADEL-like n=1 Tax=Mya arenaria TaxID=6604 RepID=UPI0022E1907A|nr:lectin ADEL-like [Mya arenaria]
MFVWKLAALLLVFVAAEGCDKTKTIRCSSHGYKYAECKVPGGYGNAIITKTRMFVWKLAALLLVFVAAESCDITNTIRCSSHGYKYAECIVPGGYGNAIITVINKLSRSSCTLGRSYGYRNGKLWVDRGCRAVFSVCLCRNFVSMNCDSWSYKFKSCPVSGASRVSKVALKSKRSRSPCTLGRSFGSDSNSIWVDRGCRATFDVCYK